MYRHAPTDKEKINTLVRLSSSTLLMRKCNPKTAQQGLALSMQMERSSQPMDSQGMDSHKRSYLISWNDHANQ